MNKVAHLYLARRFRENSRQYFGNPHHSALGPSSLPTVLSEEAIQGSTSLLNQNEYT